MRLDDRPSLDDYLGLWSLNPVQLAVIGSIARRMLREPEWMDPLQKRWYDSQQEDQSVYDDDGYIAELWRCWVRYSRGYLLDLRSSFISDWPVASVVDVGNGFGYTTLGLSELWPRAKVFGTNVSEPQMAVARSLGVDVRPGIEHPVDLVFASEYFEHWRHPIEHLDDVLDAADPIALVCANTFNGVSTGHFDMYWHHDVAMTGRQTSRRFNARLRERGFSRVETGFWNNRPAVWERR